jgi:hypothetical protein
MKGIGRAVEYLIHILDLPPNNHFSAPLTGLVICFTWNHIYFLLSHICLVLAYPLCFSTEVLCPALLIFITLLLFLLY